MPNNSTFQPTLLQKLLGRNYKWWYISKYYFRLGDSYFFDNLFLFGGRSIVIYSAILIWSFSSNSVEFMGNLVFGLIFFSLTINTIYWMLGQSIEDGSISRYLILPTSFFKHFFFISMGFLAKLIIFHVIILAPAFLFFSQNFVSSFSFTGFLLAIIALPIAIFIKFCISFMLGLLVFWTTKIFGQANFYESIDPLLLGIVFPYSLISVSALKTILEFLPWSYVVHHPMQIYLGKYGTIQTIWVFLGGIAWCVVLYFLAKLLFKLGLKRNESVGL